MPKIFTYGNLIRKCVYREFYVAVFMVWGISLWKTFWVVNTRWAPVQKQFKGSTSNFAHTFLTDCCTKLCLTFFLIMSYSFFIAITRQALKAYAVKSRLFKKYLERRKSWAGFCLSLGWLHISENWKIEKLKTAVLLVQELGI